MGRCCPHDDADHQVATICTDVIHYPSEDYPCLCEALTGDDEHCTTCEYRRTSHVVTRTCKPRDGGVCECAVT